MTKIYFTNKSYPCFLRDNTNKRNEKRLFYLWKSKGNQGRCRGKTLEGSEKPNFQGKFLKNNFSMVASLCVFCILITQCSVSTLG